jgi:hypothetical protein
MMRTTPSLLLFVTLIAVSCAGPVQAPSPAAVAPPPAQEPVAEQKPIAAAPQVQTPEKKEPVELVWRMKKGRLTGPGKSPSPKQIGKFKNKKGNGYTIDYCSDFGDFAIFESKSTDEVGSAEINIRRRGTGPLCKDDFKGAYTNLKIREGSFAGVAGDLVVTEGADVGEGVVESQIFSLKDGHEIFRVIHNPQEEYVLKKSGPTVSVVYFAKVRLKCDLPTEGRACWSRIVEENHLPKSVKMPDCAHAFKKAGKNLTEPAQVTVKAHVANIQKPKIEFLGGSATCAPEP